METKEFISYSTEDQYDLVRFIVDCLQTHPIACFFGEMGVGKTSLIKNICNFLKVNEEVSSPTFSLVNEYESDAQGVVYHFDFYRINDESEAMDMGCEEYFYSGQICLIEWPEMIENVLPEKWTKVELREENNQRIIAVSTVN